MLFNIGKWQIVRDEALGTETRGRDSGQEIKAKFSEHLEESWVAYGDIRVYAGAQRADTADVGAGTFNRTIPATWGPQPGCPLILLAHRNFQFNPESSSPLLSAEVFQVLCWESTRKH